MAGFANGVCEYDFISQYDDECCVLESTASLTLSGNCDIDVNEVRSSRAKMVLLARIRTMSPVAYQFMPIVAPALPAMPMASVATQTSLSSTPTSAP